MKPFLTLALVPLAAGFLCAQNSDTTTRVETKTTTTSSSTNYSGTLMDAGCYSKNTVHKETTTSSSATGNTTRTETTRETIDCPVTTATSSFVLRTPEGKIVRFDPASDTKFIEVMKSNKDWNREITERSPIRVKVIGTANGDFVVVNSIE